MTPRVPAHWNASSLYLLTVCCVFGVCLLLVPPADAKPKISDLEVIVMPSLQGLSLFRVVEQQSRGFGCLAFAIDTERKQNSSSLLVSGGNLVSFPFWSEVEMGGLAKKNVWISDSGRLKNRTE